MGVIFMCLFSTENRKQTHFFEKNRIVLLFFFLIFFVFLPESLITVAKSEIQNPKVRKTSKNTNRKIRG